LRIAVCDDAPADLEKIRLALDAFLSARSVKADVEVFAHPDSLLSAAYAAPFDLYLLDVVMPMVDGLSVARELRRFHRRVPVVYFTTSGDYALEAFGVHALGYVVKPWTRRQFDETLAAALESVKKDTRHFLSVKTSEGMSLIDIETIVCVTVAKTANHKTLHLQDGRAVDVRMTLESIAKVCSEGPGGIPFFADGRYSLVNPYHVRSIVGETVTFDNGETLAIHHNCSAALRRAVAGLPW